MTLRFPWPAALLGLALGACGGGGSGPAADTAQQAAAAAPRRHALAAAIDTRIVYPTDLFNWAEQHYPQFLPSHASNQEQAPFVYRHYPATGNYVGLAEGVAYSFGPMTNGQLQSHGPATELRCLVYPDECSRPPITLPSSYLANLMSARTANALWVYEALGHTLMTELFDALALQPVGSGTPPPIPATVTLACVGGGSGTLRFIDSDNSRTLTIGDRLQASATSCVLDNGSGPEFSGTIEIRVIDGRKTENYLQTDATGAIDLLMSFGNVRTRFGVINGNYRRASYFLDDRLTYGASSHFDELVVTGAGDSTLRFTDVHLSFPGEARLGEASGAISVTMEGLGTVRNELSLPVPPAVGATTLRYRPSNGTLRLAGTGYWLDVVYQADRATRIRVDNGRDGSVDLQLDTNEDQLDALLKVY